MAKLDPLVGTIVKFPPVPGELVNSCNSYPYVGLVCAVQTELKPAIVLSCQNFSTPVLES